MLEPAPEAPTGRAVHRLVPRGPNDGARLLAFVGAHAVPGVESWDGTTYCRSLRLAGGPATARIRVHGRAFWAEVTVTDEADRPDALGRLAHLLGLADDPTPGQQHLSADPWIGPLATARPGLRAPGSVDHGETLVRTVVGQQVSLAGARAVGGRLASAHGERLPGTWTAAHPTLTHVFPAAETLAALGDDDPALAMPRARARAVVRAAGAVVAAGGLPARADLLAVPGIGPWTADYIDLRCRRDPDVFLPTDLAARRALERLGVDGRQQPSVAAAWAPHRTLALMHLWAEYLSL